VHVKENVHTSKRYAHLFSSKRVLDPEQHEKPTLMLTLLQKDQQSTGKQAKIKDKQKNTNTAILA
jgi:hypothetical protein